MRVRAYVVEKIDQNLLKQHAVRLHKQDLIERIRTDGKRVRHLLVFQHRAADDFLQNLVLLFQRHLAGGKARYGQQVFRHAHKPLCVALDIFIKTMSTVANTLVSVFRSFTIIR